ncbi:hypothetical protein HC031_05865 [Planosporangium thailandense]|uniref:Uncharacterized protein n=1 Tax=Planosporangium thailandense TaxID=765197 RepID=A0ABX0XTC2_9ACTN|nr:hypothetical protein [Planosporangium thailandense]NJC69246.1 hypothetical protein [Planosporangium thailandense]
MDDWEAVCGDLTKAHDLRGFVDGLDEKAVEELNGLALARLARLVCEAMADATSVNEPGDRSTPAGSEPVRFPSQGQLRVAVPLGVG